MVVWLTRCHAYHRTNTLLTVHRPPGARRGVPVRRILPCRHKDSIVSVAISVDGSLLAVASETLCHVWRLHDDGLESTIAATAGADTQSSRGSTYEMKAVTFSPDGLWVVTASLDGKLRFHAVGTGELKATVQPDDAQQAGIRRAAILCLAFSRDGRLLVTGSVGGSVIGWDVVEGRLAFAASSGGHHGRVLDVSVTADGSLIASASSDSTVIIWDRTGHPLEQLAHTAKRAVSAVRLALDGSYVVTGGTDGIFRLWQPRSPGDNDEKDGVWECTMALSGWHGRETAVEIRALDLCDARRWVAVGCADGSGALVDLDTGLSMRRLDGGRDAVNSVAITWAGDVVAMGGNDKQGRVWDLEGGSSVSIPRAFESLKLTAIALSPNQELIAALNMQRTSVLVWRLDDALFNHRASATELVATEWTPRMDMSKSSREDTQRVRDADGSIALRRIVFSADAAYVVGASDVGSAGIYIWRLEETRLIAKLRFKGVCAESVQASLRLVVAGSRDGTLRVWALDALSGSKEALYQTYTTSYHGTIPTVAIAHDEGVIAAASGDHRIRVWRMGASEPGPELKGHEDHINGLVFMRTTGNIVSCSDDTTMRIWDHENGRCLTTLWGHAAAVRGVASQGDLLTSVSDDRSVKVWSEGTCIRTLPGLSSGVVAVSAAESGSLVVYLDRDNQVQAWEAMQEPSRGELWDLLQRHLAGSDSEDFLHTVSRYPALLLENNECPGSKAHNLIHHLVTDELESLVTHVLSVLPETALACDRVVDAVVKAGQVPSIQRACHLLRRAVKARNGPILHCMLTSLSELLVQPGRLNNVRAFLDMLSSEDFSMAMTDFPDLSLQAMRPLLTLRPSHPSVAGCKRRILGAGGILTASSNEPFPTAFWKCRLAPPPWWHYGCCQQQGHGPPRGRLRGEVWMERWRLLLRFFYASGSSPKPLVTTSDLNQSGSTTQLEVELDRHERLGTAVAPFVIAVRDIAGPPFWHKRRGRHSFLQACVDACMKTRSAAVFELDAVVAVLTFKWHTYARRYYVQELLIYCLYLALFTCSCFGDWSKLTTTRVLLDCVVLLYTSVFCLREYFQMVSQGLQHYVSDGWNYIDVSTYCLCTATVLLRLAAPKSNASYVLPAVAMLPAWLRLLWYMRGFSRTGVLIRLIYEVTSDIRFFFGIIVLITVGFALSFHLLHPHDEDFATLPSSWLTCLMYIFGTTPELSVFQDSRSGPLAAIFYVVYMSLSSVILLNILISVMGDSFSRIQANAVLEWRLEQATIILEVESLLDKVAPSVFGDRSLFPRYLQVLRVPDTVVRRDGWQGTMGAITKQLRALNTSTDHRLNQLEQVFHNRMDQLSGRLEKLERTLQVSFKGELKRTSQSTGRDMEAVYSVIGEFKELKNVLRKLEKSMTTHCPGTSGIEGSNVLIDRQGTMSASNAETDDSREASAVEREDREDGMATPTKRVMHVGREPRRGPATDERRFKTSERYSVDEDHEDPEVMLASASRMSMESGMLVESTRRLETVTSVPVVVTDEAPQGALIETAKMQNSRDPACIATAPEESLMVAPAEDSAFVEMNHYFDA